MTESEKLWRVWWLWGIPTAWAASALIVFAESTRSAGYNSWGDFLDVVRLALYWWWMRLAWKCARNVDNSFWTYASRGVLALGLVVNVLA
jgi:hypothetical protein